MTAPHRQAFLDEAQELLAELESSLLELDRRPDDPELVQRAFRALHTIKGSGAMFGFDAVSRFTHELETAFDQVRTGCFPVTSDLIQLTLAARDQIKTLLELPETTAQAGTAASASLLEQIRTLMSGGEAPDPARVKSRVIRRWRIHFRPARGIFLKGTNPLLLFRELEELGGLELKAGTEAVPDLASIRADQCYLAWDMVLTTEADSQAIRDVFIFVEDDCELSIEPLDDAAPPSAKAAQEPEQTAQKASAERKVANPAAGDASIRVATVKLDSLVNFVGELVIMQARLTQAAARSADPAICLIAEEVERLTAGLRDNALNIRMVPLRATFDRFRRLVHDLTRELGKDVELITDGAETELDKTVIDQLNDPLLHLIRNSMDHGIESPEGRVAAGKARTGTIHLSAIHSGANVLIRVADDGCGLDVHAIRARAVEKGLLAADAQLSEADILSFILMPGFSTARQVTGLSGRGVGMDIVRRSVDNLRGSVEVSSKPGAGNTVTLRLPLTLAIIDGLLVRSGDAHFVLPLSNVLECIELTRDEVRNSRGKRIVNLRGDLIPYIRLREHFRIGGEQPAIEQIMIAEAGAERYGFAVDEVLGDHQTVIKNLGRIYRDVQEISGATILGDGTVALIIDPERLVHNVLRKAGARVAARDSRDRAE